MSEAGRYAPLKQTHEQVAQSQSAQEADQQNQPQQQPSQSPPVHQHEIDDEITRDTRELQRKIADTKERFPNDPHAIREVIHQHQVQDNQKVVDMEAAGRSQDQAHAHASGDPGARSSEIDARAATQAADLSQGLKGNQQPDQSQSKEPTDEQKRRALELAQGVEARQQQQQEQALAKGQEQQQSHER